MLYFLVIIFSGLCFGLGMAISGMIDPNNVLSFLSIFNRWNPSLMFVIGGALLVFLPVYQFGIKKRNKPVLAKEFCLTKNTQVDKELVIGSVIFGMGWGLLGVCPGPVVSSLFLGNPDAYWFLTAMLLGFAFVKVLDMNTEPQTSCDVQ